VLNNDSGGINSTDRISGVESLTSYTKSFRYLVSTAEINPKAFRTLKLQLSARPAPRTLEQKRQWVQEYIAPTLKMLKRVDDNTGESVLDEIIENAVLKPKQESMLWDYLEQLQIQLT